MRRVLVRTVSVLVVLLMATPAWAAPGELDTSFGGDGIVAVDYGGTSEEFWHGAPDGAKIVAAGAVDDDFAVARLRPGGAPDPDFGGGDGRRTIDFGFEDGAYGVAVYPTGRVAVVGWANDAGGDARLAVARLRPSGKLDRTFSGDGRTTVRSPDGLPVYAYDAVVQPDGKLVVVGESYDGGDGRFVVCRFTRKGRLDRAFHHDGRLTLNVGPGVDGAWRVALTADGQIVVAGWSEGASYRTAVARFLPNGRRDTSFSKDGMRVLDLAPGYDSAVGLGLARDGGVVIGARADNGGEDPHIVKLTARGKNDPSFGGGDGIVSNFADGYTLVDIGIRSDGRILGVTSSGAAIAAFLVSRMGVFGAGYGLVVTATNAEIEAMYVDAKGRPVITGREGGEASIIRLKA
ncbi:MAG: hypothetical protein OEW31_04145 [Thermoleophilia bacterium]|nr:hypothetical protein [Thermoleophilia bacterium]MDH4345508.1 hypothetical protein [Thermoleophilia bacterium]